MRAGLLALVVACAGIGAASAAAADDDSPLPAGGPRRAPEFQARVDLAIARGVRWLRGVQSKSGAFPWGEMGGSSRDGAYPFGTTAIAVHTLRSCGVPADDPQVVAGIDRMRKAWNSGFGRTTYEAALGLLALEAHHLAPSTASKRPDPRAIPAQDREWIRSIAGCLLQCQSSDGSFGYGPTRGTSAWTDHSNAQYGLLGLKAARRCGIAIRPEVFRRALDHFLAAQEPDGPVVNRRREGGVGEPGRSVGTTRAVAKDRARGWGYQGSRGTTGAMTSGGVSSLVICRGELLGTALLPAALDGRTVEAIRDGIAWLGKYFSVTWNPTESGAAGWLHYYLYGLERAGVLAGVAWMGEHDWYGEGAEQLLRTQRKTGGWDGEAMLRRRGRKGAGAGDGDLLDTCFALLFLKKATFRVDGAVATEHGEETLDLSGAASLDDTTFHAVFQAVFERYRRAAADRRGTLVADFVLMGRRAIPHLVQRLEDEEQASREIAIEVLQRVTGLTHGYRAADEPEVRGKAVVAWEEWWFAHRGRLVADPAAGRFR